MSRSGRVQRTAKVLCIARQVLTIASSRLALRPWQVPDLDDLLALNRDPRVSRWLGGSSLADASETALVRYRTQFQSNGYGVFHISDRAGHFLGLAGVQPVRQGLPTFPGTEVVWRFRSDCWGRGYAFEAMTAILAGMPSHAPKDLIAAISRPNLRSAKLAERLGFCHHPEDDYLYPDDGIDAVLRPHRVFRLRSNSQRAA
ncbi:GNAT family N-acetyltransferase [Castellaniella denitrificans]|uniref:GNAT family N-acetyltransferase n=1 Tax=Castellaniella denitrificans TaxID=56119 RepID=A0ABT4M597_9BURK|nr:GNAT family N-acetyltransferase [Castellaniella denitrificans]